MGPDLGVVNANFEIPKKNVWQLRLSTFYLCKYRPTPRHGPNLLLLLVVRRHNQNRHHHQNVLHIFPLVPKSFVEPKFQRSHSFWRNWHLSSILPHNVLHISWSLLCEAIDRSASPGWTTRRLLNVCSILSFKCLARNLNCCSQRRT